MANGGWVNPKAFVPGVAQQASIRGVAAGFEDIARRKQQDRQFKERLSFQGAEAQKGRTWQRSQQVLELQDRLNQQIATGDLAGARATAQTIRQAGAQADWYETEAGPGVDYGKPRAPEMPVQATRPVQATPSAKPVQLEGIQQPQGRAIGQASGAAAGDALVDQQSGKTHAQLKEEARSTAAQNRVTLEASGVAPAAVEAKIADKKVAWAEAGNPIDDETARELAEYDLAVQAMEESEAAGPAVDQVEAQVAERLRRQGHTPLLIEHVIRQGRKRRHDRAVGWAEEDLYATSPWNPFAGHFTDVETSEESKVSQAVEVASSLPPGTPMEDRLAAYMEEMGSEDIAQAAEESGEDWMDPGSFAEAGAPQDSELPQAAPEAALGEPSFNPFAMGTPDQPRSTYANPRGLGVAEANPFAMHSAGPMGANAARFREMLPAAAAASQRTGDPTALATAQGIAKAAVPFQQGMGWLQQHLMRPSVERAAAARAPKPPMVTVSNQMGEERAGSDKMQQVFTNRDTKKTMDAWEVSQRIHDMASSGNYQLEAGAVRQFLRSTGEDRLSEMDFRTGTAGIDPATAVMIWRRLKREWTGERGLTDDEARVLVRAAAVMTEKHFERLQKDSAAMKRRAQAMRPRQQREAKGWMQGTMPAETWQGDEFWGVTPEGYDVAAGQQVKVKSPTEFGGKGKKQRTPAPKRAVKKKSEKEKEIDALLR